MGLFEDVHMKGVIVLKEVRTKGGVIQTVTICTQHGRRCEPINLPVKVKHHRRDSSRLRTIARCQICKAWRTIQYGSLRKGSDLVRLSS